MQAPFTDWFARRGWTIHPHQSDMLARKDAPALLLIAPTGGGKTLAGSCRRSPS
jgi:ATP-dependent helicase Lhr and Lhr-like helicase